MATPRLRMHPNVACIYGRVQNVQNHGVAVRVSMKDLQQINEALWLNQLVTCGGGTVLLSF